MTISINLKSRPYYNGTKTLDGNVYKLKFRWNTYTEKWYMDIDGLTNSVSIKSIPLLTGKNLLAPYGYRELGQLYVIDKQNAGEEPNYEDIGTRFVLEYTPIE